MVMSTLLTDLVDGVATVILNRPDIHNAFDDALIAALTNRFAALEDDPNVRVVVLKAAGMSFSAGADLNWMRRMAGYSEPENLADARGLATLMQRLNFLPKPTIAAVQGPAYGGGVGLVAACDIAVAVESAAFALTEVRLGLIPAVISPYVVSAIGERAARRYFLTAERFDAATAYRLGLVHEVVAPAELDAAVGRHIANLLQGGPVAQAAAKKLIRRVGRGTINVAMIDDTAERIARARAGEEGREGLTAFLEKRKPSWSRPG
jgi:methylglutaconyl-CoA hydratase